MRCQFHLVATVTRRGSLKVAGLQTLPAGAPDEQAEPFIEAVAELVATAPHTCTLDVAADGEHTWEEIAEVMRELPNTITVVAHRAIARSQNDLNLIERLREKARAQTTVEVQRLAATRRRRRKRKARKRRR